jgi:hypothetical protein
MNPDAELAFNLSALKSVALFTGLPYLIAGLACGPFFLRWTTRKPLSLCVIPAFILHLVSTGFALYALPVLTYIIVRTPGSWQLALTGALISGIPSAVIDFVVLCLIYRKLFSFREFGKLLAWKASTLLICFCYGLCRGISLISYQQ